MCVLQNLSPGPTPIRPTVHDRFCANNSMASTKVSMLAGKTDRFRRLSTGDWTVVSLVSCRLLAPHFPCPVQSRSAFR
jgi:hypothetical protein